jgi:hypothetical protein
LKLDRTVLLLVALALIPIVPQILFGYGGHDFRQHVPSWMELRDLWGAGQFHAGWAPLANFTLGDLRFSYYPPVSFMIGAGLAMLLPFKLVPAAYVWLTFMGCGLAMYYASRDFVAPEDRWKAAVLYMASPYLLTTSLVRFAAAEAMTLTWLPFVFLYLYRAVWTRDRRATLLLGCLLGVTWLTNVPASIVLLYALLPAVFVLAVIQRSLRPLLALFFAECIAAGLAAFYLAPTWFEQEWIHRDEVLRDNYATNFLFTPLSHVILVLFVLAIWLYLCVSVALVAFYAWAGRRDIEDKSQTQPQIRTWLTVTLVCFFFNLPISAILWKYLPELRFADFPFRFMAPVGVMVPLMLLARSTPKRWRVPSYVLLGVLALLPIREYRAAKSALVNLKEVLPEWRHQGYRGWPEFVPAEATRPLDPPAFPAASAASGANTPQCTAAVQSSHDIHKVLVTQAAAPCQIRVAQFFYSYWRATDESGNVLPTSRDPYGLLLIQVPAGQHTIQLAFVAASTARSVSIAVSILTLLVILLILFNGNLRLRFGFAPRIDEPAETNA